MRGKSQAPAFERLSAEVRLLFHQLRAVAEAIHEKEREITASHRGVLESLYREGPRTVPALARARPVARQHIQVLVNDLSRLGLVSAGPNPAHRRSPVVALTTAGRHRFEAMHRREQAALAALDLPVGERALRDTAAVLQKVRQWLAESFA